MALNKDYQAVVGISFDDTKLKKQLESLNGKTVKVNVEVKGGLGNLNKALKDTNKLLKETEQSLRNVEKSSKNLDTGVKSLEKSNKKLGDGLDTTSKKSKKAADAFNHTANHGKSFSAMITDITKKVLAFGGVTQAILMVKRAFGEAVEITKSYDAALTDFKKVSDLSGQALEDYGKKLGQLGEDVYRTRTEMIESATLFKQAGYDEADAAQLARIGELYKNVADAQISSAEASSFVVSQMKAFNITADDAITIIDKVNEVSNNFAVSSSDIASGLTRNSAALAAYGNTIDESIALITSGAEIMTGKAGQVSNGLKTIGANIAKMASTAKTLEFQANKTAYSISLIDENTGDLKSTYQVLKDVSVAWDTMSQSEKTNLALKMAGKTQISVFTSVMGNFNAAIEANEVAMNSAGSAMEENSKRADSLEAKYASLRREVEELVLGEGGFNSFLKATLSLTTGIVKLMRDTNGLPVLLADIGVAFGVVLIPKAIALGKEYMNLATKAIAATKSTHSLSAGLKEAGITASATQLAIAGLTAVISIAIMAMSAVHASNEKAKQQAQETASKLNEEAKSLGNVVEKLKDESLKREDLISAINATNSKYKDELSHIKDVNELREKGIELIQSEEEERLRAAQAAASSEYTRAKDEMSNGSNLQLSKNAGKYLGQSPSDNYSAPRDTFQVFEFKNPEAKLSALQSAIDLATKAKLAGEDNQKVLDELSKAYNELSGQIETNNEAIKEYEANAWALSDLTKEQIDGALNLAGAFLGLNTSVMGLSESTSENQDVVNDWFNDLDPSEVELLAKALKISTEEFYENAAAMGLSLKQYSQFATDSRVVQKEMDNTNESIDGLQSALGVAQNAWKEYNEGGSLTLDTFQSLLAISPQYLGALINENGQISVNEESLKALVEQLKVAKIEELQNAAAADILALANGNTAEMSDTAKKAVSDLGIDIAGTGDDATTATGKMLGFASSVYATVNAMQGLASGELPDNFEAQQQAIIDAYQKIGEKVTSISVDTSKNVATGVKKDAKAAKKGAKDRTDAYKEAYQKELDALDHRLAMGEILEEEYYESLKELNERYFGAATGQQEKYLDEYQKNQEKIYKWEEKQRQESLKAQKSLYDKALEHMQTVKKKQLDMLKEERDEELSYLDERIDKVEKQRDREIKAIDKKLKLLKEEKKVAVENLNVQIKGLEDLRDKEKTYWDEKIDAYKAQTKELQEQIDLQKLQEQLALAKSGRAMILKDGKFVQGEKESDVAAAEQAIQDYYDSLKQQKELQAMEDARDASLKYYQAQIDSLKLYKDDMSSQFDAQIDRLEEHKEQLEEYYEERLASMKEHRAEVQEEYDGQIKDMEDYIDKFDEMVNEYETTQNRMAFIQLQGAEQEKKIWDNRLDNFREFVREYNSLKAELDDDKVSSSSKSSGRSVSSTNIVPGRATGDASVAEDGWSMVGDNPNYQELHIGSKLNGSFTKISKGDGVVNAEGTKTLAGILNSLPSSLGLRNFKEKEDSGGMSNSLTIDKVYVQADDSMQFIDSMAREFKIRMKQDAFKPARA